MLPLGGHMIPNRVFDSVLISQKGQPQVIQKILGESPFLAATGSAVLLVFREAAAQLRLAGRRGEGHAERHTGAGCPLWIPGRQRLGCGRRHQVTNDYNRSPLMQHACNVVIMLDATHTTTGRWSRVSFPKQGMERTRNGPSATAVGTESLSRAADLRCLSKRFMCHCHCQRPRAPARCVQRSPSLSSHLQRASPTMRQRLGHQRALSMKM